MTTREFIRNTYGVTSTRERHCSSVFTDYDGNVYSYGYHYPLLFQVAGTWFINVRGYSNSTAKHISWAQDASDYRAVPVELDEYASRVIASNGHWDETDKLNELERVTRKKVARLQAELASKKRKDTQVYTRLREDWRRARVSYVKVRALQGEVV